MTGFFLSFLCFMVGCNLAFNSCGKNPEEPEWVKNPENKPNEEPKDEPEDPADDPVEVPSVSHYDGLEEVIIPAGLAQQIKEYTGFTVCFNKDNHTPNYVAWELLGTEVTNLVDRSDNFWQDTEIEGCPAHRDYTGSGYDRGHMCPAADQKWSEEAMNDCFVMANMCPQDHQLNAGAWETLESKERTWAKRDSAIMIIAGPIYEETDTKRLGSIGVRVPSSYFKALLAPYVDSPRAIAFVYPNSPAPGNMKDYAMTVDQLEEILGYDLFSALPDDLENKIESEFSFTEWNSSN